MSKKIDRGRSGGQAPVNNPVAKFAMRANNRCVAFRDQRQYRRKPKHPRQESWPMTPIVSVGSIGEGSRGGNV